MSADKLTVADAAKRLGISQDAVYKRVERNKIRHERDQDGRLYVYVDPSKTSQNKSTDSQTDRYIASLEDQVRYLRDEVSAERRANEENRRIIAGLVQRVPELEPASEPQKTSESVDETAERVNPSSREEPREEVRQRPWYQRWFGG